MFEQVVSKYVSAPRRDNTERAMNCRSTWRSGCNALLHRFWHGRGVAGTAL